MCWMKREKQRWHLLTYEEVGDELHWQVSVTKAASEQPRELTVKLGLEQEGLEKAVITSSNAQLNDGWIDYHQEATTNEQIDTISFTTPNDVADYTYTFVPELQELTETSELEKIAFEKEQYEVKTMVRANEAEATTDSSVQITESTLVPTEESESEVEQSSDSESTARRSETAVPNPLAGMIGQGLLERAVPTTYAFDYASDNGNYLTNGIASGNTYNYAYGQTGEVPFDDEDYVNYEDIAYLKKSVAENAAKQGLFDVTLDVKGNQTENPIDLVLVIDYSSSMTGDKLQNAIKGVSDFLEEIKGSLGEDQVKIAIVAYNRYVYSTGGFLTDASQLLSFMSNTAESHTGTFIQKGLYEAESLFNTAGAAMHKKCLFMLVTVVPIVRIWSRKMQRCIRTMVKSAHSMATLLPRISLIFRQTA